MKKQKGKLNRRVTDLHNHPWRDNWYRVRSLQSETARWDRKTGREYRRRRWRGTSPVARSIPPRESPSLDHTAPSPPTPTEACTPSAARSVVPDPRETASFRFAPTSEIASSSSSSLRSIRFIRFAAVGATVTASTASGGMPWIGLGFRSNARTGEWNAAFWSWPGLIWSLNHSFISTVVCVPFLSLRLLGFVFLSQTETKKNKKIKLFFLF